MALLFARRLYTCNILLCDRNYNSEVLDLIQDLTLKDTILLDDEFILAPQTKGGPQCSERQPEYWQEQQEFTHYMHYMSKRLMVQICISHSSL